MMYKKKGLIPNSSQTTNSVDNRKRFSSEQWLKVYTDGSQNEIDNSRAGIYSYLSSSLILLFPVGQNKPNFGTEMEAISYPLLNVLNHIHNFQKLVINGLYHTWQYNLSQLKLRW